MKETERKRSLTNLRGEKREETHHWAGVGGRVGGGGGGGGGFSISVLPPVTNRPVIGYCHGDYMATQAISGLQRGQA